MKRHTQIETNRETLKRIVALLFSMAVLADLVSTRPRRVRCEVLALLRNAEIVGCSIALEDAYGVVASPELIASTFSHGGNSSSDARRLAVVLRALALTLTVRFALHCDFADNVNNEGNHRPGDTVAPRDAHIAASILSGRNQAGGSFWPAIPP